MNLKSFFAPILSKFGQSPKTAKIEQKQKSFDKRGINYRLRRTFTPKADLQIAKWEQAIVTAQNPMMPNRVNLYRLYEWAVKDGHTRSQLRTAHITVKRSDFVIQVDGKDNEEMTEYFKKPWFSQYLRHALDAEFWGHSLIEFAPKFDENGEFIKIILIPREHVRPEEHIVLINPFDNTGIDYKGKPFNKWLIEVGEPCDLGILESVTKEVIYKTYGRKDWAIRSEKFGMPSIILKTASSDDAEIDKKEEGLANFGSNSYMILDDDDEAVYLESSSAGNGHLIYKDKVELTDKYISKIINGQTATSDEQAFVGSAEVQERLLNDYGFERLANLEAHINYELIPFLKAHGYALNNGKFKFTDLLKKKKEDKKETPTDPKKDPTK